MRAMGKNRQGALMDPLENLTYSDGYRLYDALRNGDRVAFTVGGSDTKRSSKAMPWALKTGWK